MNKKSITDARAFCKKCAEDLETLQEQRSAIVEAAENDGREYTDDEKEQLRKLQPKLDKADNEYRKAELDVNRLEMEKRRESIAEENPVAERPLLQDMILRAREGRMNDQDKEFNKRGRAILECSGVTKVGENTICIPIESRATQNATGTANLGGNTIEDVRQPIRMPLVNSLVMSQLGVTTMTGLAGNMKFPKGSALVAYWEGEEDEAGETNATFENIIFTPKRVSAQVTVTNQLLTQSSEDVEAYLIKLLNNAVAQTIQNKLLSADAATTTTPAGLFYSASALATGSFDWERAVDTKTTLRKRNALVGTPKWLITPDLMGEGEKTLKNAGVAGFVIENGRLNGHDVIECNAVPTDLGTGSNEHGMVLADWSEYFLGTWGAITIGFDPYTKMGADSVRLVVNAYVDGGKLSDESFVIETAKLS